MKRKFLCLLLIFNICFSNVSLSYANPLAIPGFVITKEAFNIIVGSAIALGITLKTNNDMHNFVDVFISSAIRPDSAEFTTYPSVEAFEEDIKNNSSRDPNGKDIIIGTLLIDKLKSIFDSISKKSEEQGYSFIHSGDVPIYPDSINYSNYKEGITNILSLPGNDYLYITKEKGGSYFKFETESSFKDRPQGHYWSTVPNRPGLIVCEESSHAHKDSNHYNIRLKSGRSYSFDVGGFVPCYYIGSVDISGYNPSLNIPSNIPNNDVFPSDNDNFKVDGELDLPDGDGSTPPDNGDNPTPPVLDFSKLDLEPLKDLFYTLGDKFPFSIPFDIVRLLGVFNVEPKAPVFEVPIYNEVIVFDLTRFNLVADVIRFFVVLGFVFGLINMSKKLGG